MMRLSCIGSLLVRFLVLNSGGQPYRELASVLRFNPEANIHTAESAHHSMTECDAALVDMRTILGRDGYTVYGATAFSDHVLLGEKGMEI